MIIFRRQIGGKCYCIAELGANHNGDYQTARRLIADAAMSGADAVKLQVYRADTLYSKHSAPKEWQVIRDHEVPYDWLWLLRDQAHAFGMGFVCSVFCKETTDEAAKYADALKIASSDNNDLGLIEYVAKQGLPVMVSLGATTKKERHAIMQTLRGAVDFALMACNAVYPSKVSDIPLRAFDTGIQGFSDHTLSEWLPAVAVAMGARIIEKHFTLDRASEGPDHTHSLMPHEFGRMVQNIRDVEAALALEPFGPTPSEIAADARRYKRSWHAARDIEGTLVDGDAIFQRPNDGSPPTLSMVGRCVGAHKKGEPI